MRKIVLLGGVFDPIHNGHLSIYHAIQKHIKPNLFIVLPSKIPPLKLSKPIAAVNQRLQMVKLAFQNFSNVVISNYEINKNSTAYTIDTLQYFKKTYPHDQLYFVVGTDRILDFKKWKKWKQILTLAKIIVVKRNNSKLDKIIPTINININPIPISSSQLRIEPNKKYLPKKVYEYIATNGIYIKQQVQKLLSAKRYQHTLRVTKLALELSPPNLKSRAYIASMYHDIAKGWTDSHIKKIVSSYDKNHFPTIHTLHGIASAIYVKEHFNIHDKIILNAISNHVIPPKNPSTLDMIIYCADKLEPARTKKDVTNRLGYINMAKKNLKLTFIKLHNEIQEHYN